MSGTNASATARSYQAMIITKMAIPRRTFLRGAGVSLALPLLKEVLTKGHDHDGLEHGLCLGPSPKHRRTGRTACARTPQLVRS